MPYKKYYQKNPEKYIKLTKKWQKENPEYKRNWEREDYKKNPEKYIKLTKKWQKENPEYKRNWEREDYKKNPEKYSERCKKWRKDNPEKDKEIQNRCRRNRYKISSKHNLIYKIKTAIRLSLKGNKNGRHWEDLVGYTLDNLIKRLQSTMPKGCSWQDFLQGKLHIDHIIPIRAFTFTKPEDEEFKQCWSLWNLRLLPAKENKSKNDSIDNPILLGLLLNY